MNEEALWTEDRYFCIAAWLRDGRVGLSRTAFAQPTILRTAAANLHGAAEAMRGRVVSGRQVLSWVRVLMRTTPALFDGGETDVQVCNELVRRNLLCVRSRSDPAVSGSGAGWWGLGTHYSVAPAEVLVVGAGGTLGYSVAWRLLAATDLRVVAADPSPSFVYVPDAPTLLRARDVRRQHERAALSLATALGGDGWEARDGQGWSRMALLADAVVSLELRELHFPLPPAFVARFGDRRPVAVVGAGRRARRVAPDLVVLASGSRTPLGLVQQTRAAASDPRRAAESVAPALVVDPCNAFHVEALLDGFRATAREHEARRLRYRGYDRGEIDTGGRAVRPLAPPVVRVAVVGSGTTALEVAGELLALRRRYFLDVHLYARGGQLVAGGPPALREAARRILIAKGMPLENLHMNCEVVRVGDTGIALTAAPDTEVPFDAVVLATGRTPNSAYAAGIEGFLNDCGLVRVHSTLQTRGARCIFAGGDVCDVDEPKLSQATLKHAAVICANLRALYSSYTNECVSCGRAPADGAAPAAAVGSCPSCQPKLRRYRPQPLLTITSIGSTSGLIDMKGKEIPSILSQGAIPAVVKELVHVKNTVFFKYKLQ